MVAARTHVFGYLREVRSRLQECFDCKMLTPTTRGDANGRARCAPSLLVWAMVALVANQ